MFCTFCGCYIPDEDTFCSWCGSRRDGYTDAAAAPAPAPVRAPVYTPAPRSVPVPVPGGSPFTAAEQPENDFDIEITDEDLLGAAASGEDDGRQTAAVSIGEGSGGFSQSGPIPLFLDNTPRKQSEDFIIEAAAEKSAKEKEAVKPASEGADSLPTLDFSDIPSVSIRPIEKKEEKNLIFTPFLPENDSEQSFDSSGGLSAARSSAAVGSFTPESGKVFSPASAAPFPASRQPDLGKTEISADSHLQQPGFATPDASCRQNAYIPGPMPEPGGGFAPMLTNEEPYGSFSLCQAPAPQGGFSPVREDIYADGYNSTVRLGVGAQEYPGAFVPPQQAPVRPANPQGYYPPARQPESSAPVNRPPAATAEPVQSGEPAPFGFGFYNN